MGPRCGPRYKSQTVGHPPMLTPPIPHYVLSNIGVLYIYSLYSTQGDLSMVKHTKPTHGSDIINSVTQSINNIFIINIIQVVLSWRNKPQGIGDIFVGCLDGLCL